MRFVDQQKKSEKNTHNGQSSVQNSVRDKKVGRWSHLLKEFPQPGSDQSTSSAGSPSSNHRSSVSSSSSSSSRSDRPSSQGQLAPQGRAQAKASASGGSRPSPKIQGNSQAQSRTSSVSRSREETAVAFRRPGEESDPVVLTVSAITRRIKGQLEGEFRQVWVQGEISNFKAHTSGHFYFSLKDRGAQINAVMFKGANSRLKFRPESGMEVVVRGKITVYEPRGNYQLFCETMEPVGAGALQQAFEQLKKKLSDEGLFATERKKSLPPFPKKVAVITSPTGAAIQDILNVMGRRSPHIHVTVVPARVQGDRAAHEIASALNLVNQVNDGFDVIIAGRGGGSLEDLWPFNEEVVARAIDASKVPVISAVGHEVDFSISDFVADLRAPTPSAAAELVCQDSQEVKARIQGLSQSLRRATLRYLESKKSQLALFKKSLINPKDKLHRDIQRVDELSVRLTQCWARVLTAKRVRLDNLVIRMRSPHEVLEQGKERLRLTQRRLFEVNQQALKQRRWDLARLAKVLDTLSPLGVLGRGYAIVFDHNKRALTSAQSVKSGQSLQVQLKDGIIHSEVKKTESLKKEP